MPANVDLNISGKPLSSLFEPETNGMLVYASKNGPEQIGFKPIMNDTARSFIKV